ncbi:MAG: TonB-dependent receptor plug domain-containing protein [Congregibacter sp.]
MLSLRYKLVAGRKADRGLLAIALLLYLWTFSASADDVSVNSLLDVGFEGLLDYEVSAPTKSLIRLSESPGAVSVITYDQIRNSSARTIPQLLRLIPGVNVRWNPMVQSIEIRSFGSNPFASEVLLLIDGIPYNSWNKGGFPQHPGFDFFNLENVKHIEVIRGAGSALYGENALNGVINIVTLSGEEYQQTRAAVFAGDRKARAVTVTHGSKFGEDASIFLSARVEEGQMPTALWRDSGSSSSGQDLFIKANYKDFQLSYYRRQDKFDGFSSVIVPAVNARFESVETIEQDVNIASVKHQKEANDGSWSVESTLSYANRNGSHCGACHAASQSQEFDKKIDHGYQLFGNMQVGIDSIENHSILFGAEFRRNSAGDSFDQVTTPSDPLEKVTQYQKFAYFVQDQISFPKQRLEAVIGLRYDSATAPDLLGDEFFPRVALVAKPTDKLTLRGGWSMAARYPTFVELNSNSRFFAAEAPEPIGILFQTDFEANPGLAAEKMKSFELGAEYVFSNHLQAKVDFYHNTVNNPIVLAYRDDRVTSENHPGKALIRGAETEVRYSPSSRWSGYVNWSFQTERQQGAGVDSAGNELEFSYAPRHKVNLGMTYEAADALSATLEWSWRGSHYAPLFWSELVFEQADAAKLDDYGYLNLHVRYRLPFNVGRSNQPVSLSFYGRNLTNETPVETFNGGDGQLAEMVGREFFIGLDYEWAN